MCGNTRLATVGTRYSRTRDPFSVRHHLRQRWRIQGSEGCVPDHHQRTVSVRVHLSLVASQMLYHERGAAVRLGDICRGGRFFQTVVLSHNTSIVSRITRVFVKEALSVFMFFLHSSLIAFLQPSRLIPHHRCAWRPTTIPSTCCT